MNREIVWAIIGGIIGSLLALGFVAMGQGRAVWVGAVLGGVAAAELANQQRRKKPKKGWKK